MYADYMRHRGLDVEEASDGEEAIARARRLKPAVIVMDLSLPNVDGWEATRRIKADRSLRDPWVIESSQSPVTENPISSSARAKPGSTTSWSSHALLGRSSRGSPRTGAWVVGRAGEHAVAAGAQRTSILSSERVENDLAEDVRGERSLQAGVGP